MMVAGIDAGAANRAAVQLMQGMTGKEASGQEKTLSGRFDGFVSFVVPGAPVGKGRPRFSRQGAYTPEKTAIYENLVKVKAEQAMDGRTMIEGAVEVSVRLIVTPPASWSQKKQREALEGRIFPTSKPDIDNVLKGIMDACNEIVFKDDKQAVDVRVVKRYGQVARAAVEVRPL